MHTYIHVSHGNMQSDHAAQARPVHATRTSCHSWKVELGLGAKGAMTFFGATLLVIADTVLVPRILLVYLACIL